MTNFNYKKYSLEQLENWVHDSMSAGEASAQEIYDTIRKAVEENYYTYKNHTSRAYELLTLLNGNGVGDIEAYDAVMREKEYYEPSMPPWGHSDLEYMVNNTPKKWILPVEVDGASGEYYMQLPDDLLDSLKWKEGDVLEYVDNLDGSFSIKKVSSKLI